MLWLLGFFRCGFWGCLDDAVEVVVVDDVVEVSDMLWQLGGGVISRLITIRSIEGTTNIKIDDVIRICLINNLAYLPLVQSHLAPQTGASIVS